MDSFKKTFNSRLFIGQLSSGDKGWCAYVLPKGKIWTKDIIDLKNAFDARDGSYLFSSNKEPVHNKDEADELVKHVEDKYGTNRWLLWSEDFSNDGDIYSIGFSKGKQGKLTEPAEFPVSSSLSLHWEKDCSISYDSAKKCISIKEPAGLKGAMGIAKDYPNGKDFPFQETRLPFDSAGLGCLELGCLEFDLSLSLQGDFDELDFGLRYFAYDKEKKTVCSALSTPTPGGQQCEYEGPDGSDLLSQSRSQLLGICPGEPSSAFLICHHYGPQGSAGARICRLP